MRVVVGFSGLAAAWACALLAGGCEPAQTPRPVSESAARPPARGDACGNEIPDCVAVCALRETHRVEFVDFYERRCAAVILGKNPDGVALAPTVPSATDAGREHAPEVWVPLGVRPTPSIVDPYAVASPASEPAECKAARVLRARKRDPEADMLSALCTAKGGDAGT